MEREGGREGEVGGGRGGNNSSARDLPHQAAVKAVGKRREILLLYLYTDIHIDLNLCTFFFQNLEYHNIVCDICRTTPAARGKQALMILFCIFIIFI